MAIDQIRRPDIDTMRGHLDHPQVVEALNKGNINEILRALPAGVTAQDIEEFLKHRAVVLDQVVLQNVQIKADDGTVPAPSPVMFQSTQTQQRLTDEEGALLLSMLGTARGAQTFRAVEQPLEEANAKLTGSDPAQDVANYGNELLNMVDEHAKEYEDFTNQLADQIFNIQLAQQLQSKREELKQEFQRIVALMREGLVDPTFVLIAMAKVRIGERGLIFSQMGQRMLRVNEEMKTISMEISGSDDYKTMELGRHEMQEKSMSLQQITGTMQRVAQDIDSIMGATKGMMEEYNRTKMDLIRRLAPGGGA